MMKKLNNPSLRNTTVLKNGMYGLLLALTVACSPERPPKTADVSKVPEPAKNFDEHLIAYIDSAARRIADPGFNQAQFVALTDSFTRYFPVRVYKEGQNTSDSTVMVTMHKSKDALEDDVVTVTLPRVLGDKLDFKSLTGHFGPLDPEPAFFREHENPPPIGLNLKKHFKPAIDGLSLLISAACFPEAKENQIVSVQVLKSKMK